jgi:hypothetical protein
LSLANLVRRMTEAGAPPEAIAIALEEIEAVQACLDARRAADRDRKRAQRERLQSANVTGQSEDIPGQSRDSPQLRVSLDKETSPRPPKEINPIPCVRGTRARLGYHRLPEGWQPSRRAPATASSQGRSVAARNLRRRGCGVQAMGCERRGQERQGSEARLGQGAVELAGKATR